MDLGDPGTKRHRVVRVLGRVALGVGVLYVAMEAVAWVAFLPLTGEAFGFSRLAARRAEVQRFDRDVVERADSGDRFGGHGLPEDWPVLHPYVGFAFDPERWPERWGGWVRSDGADPFAADPGSDGAGARDERVVVLTGGSVAHMMEAAWPELEAELRRVPGLERRPLRFVSLATPGFKEPQQWMALAYYLVLGGRVDVLVNLDGFNEVGLEMIGVARRGVEPSYPRIWLTLATDFENLEDRTQLESLYALKKIRSIVAGAFDRVGWSVTANLTWYLVDLNLNERQTVAERRLTDAMASSALLKFPRFPGDQDAAFEDSVRVWARASRLMQELADRRGFRYYHFLQPNQYVPGSKPFTDEERSRFLRMGLLAERVPRWYARLEEEGARLAADGVAFTSLTGLFRGVEETVYDDPCCHVNELGNRLLAREIGRVVADDLTAH